MKRLQVVLILLVLVVLSLVVFSLYSFERGKTLAEELFQLPEATSADFLSEEVALEYANRLLTQRFPSATWKPNEDDRGVALNGTKDQFLLRNTKNSSVNGRILFINVTPSDTIPNRVSARLILRERELTCVLLRTK